MPDFSEDTVKCPVKAAFFLLLNSCNVNDATPASWSIASLNTTKHITKCHWRSCWSMEKAVTCIREVEMTSLWTAKIKPARSALFRAANSLPRKTRYVLRQFRRSYLKENRPKISRSEETRKVEYAYNFWKCDDAFTQKLSKSVHACRNYSLPKLARFFETRCRRSTVKLDTLARDTADWRDRWSSLSAESR